MASHPHLCAQCSTSALFPVFPSMAQLLLPRLESRERPGKRTAHLVSHKDWWLATVLASPAWSVCILLARDPCPSSPRRSDLPQELKKRNSTFVLPSKHRLFRSSSLFLEQISLAASEQASCGKQTAASSSTIMHQVGSSSLLFIAVCRSALRR